MLLTNQLAKQVITFLQQYIQQLGFTPVIHFELEGCYRYHPHNKGIPPLDLSVINHQLKKLDIDGEVIDEYWQNQWEFVSAFQGQMPLREAENLTKVIASLPHLFAKQGIMQTLIKPVVWAGDKGKLASGCRNVFSGEARDVHIPNAIQMNVSVNNSSGENIIYQDYFGEYLQQCFLDTSLACCLLYLPEEEAFERFALKSKYGLAEELCSPNDISGGHQGSIALYKEWGKHNQAMGETPLLFDHQHKAIVTKKNWQATARIEHRLGASSTCYNAYINIVFALVNVIDALEVYLQEQCEALLINTATSTTLPQSLHTINGQRGAIEYFQYDTWFASRINDIAERFESDAHDENKALHKIGDKLKTAILSSYHTPKIII